jgi:hypothetical protein
MPPFLALITPIGSAGSPGTGLPYPDQTLPTPQPPFPTRPPAYPDQSLPPFPSHPIVVPPGGVWPPNPPVGQPPYPDQSLPPFPSHPIVLPPNLPPTLPSPDNRPVDWKTAWTPATGWIVIGIPTGPVPTPAA